MRRPQAAHVLGSGFATSTGVPVTAQRCLCDDTACSVMTDPALLASEVLLLLDTPGKVEHVNVRVGLCGWTISQSSYVLRFPVLEVQHTFYDPPTDAVLARWRTQ